MQRARAEVIGVAALGWLAGQPEDFGAFLAAGGLTLEDVRARAGEAEFLGFLLDFLLGDEALLREFTGAHRLSPDAPMRARAALPGGDVWHWT